jgi:hypothetical protein
MTLREAAERTGRSITTLRRYIRSGRLHAEKRYGRFGPEYYVSEQDLTDAGLETEQRRVEPRLPEPSNVPHPAVPADGRQDHGWLREIVPLGLYQELQMKHEQLLVQYGMVRAGGLRAVETRGRFEEAKRTLARLRQQNERLRTRLESENERLRGELRSARLELEGKRLEVAALEEKTKALEMLSRNRVTDEAIDVQLRKLDEQQERIRSLRESAKSTGTQPGPGQSAPEDAPTDH